MKTIINYASIGIQFISFVAIFLAVSAFDREMLTFLNTLQILFVSCLLGGFGYFAYKITKEN